jgi:signal transduction histidine kinase
VNHLVAIAGFDRPLRVASWLPEGRPGFVLAVREPGRQPLLEQIARTLAILWAVVVATGTAVTWWSARRPLRRVERLTQMAESIDDPASGRRLEDPGHSDEIARLTSTLNQMLDRIADAVQEIRHMSQDAAHDLRTPLTAIRGRLEMALAESAEGWQDTVAEALEGIDRLETMLQSVLDIAEGEGRALELHRRRLDLAQLNRDLVELYAPAAQERGLDLVSEAAGEVILRADPELLQRAMSNLFDNALHHVRGGRRVESTVRRLPNGDVEIVVEDDGEGFDPEVAQRAFERSVRRPGSTGFGLGLALVRAAARAHGGDVSLGTSRLGGAQVRLVLPGTGA